MENEKIEKTQREKMPPKMVFPENLRPFYANFANFHFSLTELTINFAYRTDEKNAEVGAKIILSPQHAKIFHEVLTKLLNDYEKNIGEIPTQNK